MKYLLKYSPGNTAGSTLSSIKIGKFDLHPMSRSRCGRDSEQDYTEDSGGVDWGKGLRAENRAQIYKVRIPG